MNDEPTQPSVQIPIELVWEFALAESRRRTALDLVAVLRQGIVPDQIAHERVVDFLVADRSWAEAFAQCAKAFESQLVHTQGSPDPTKHVTHYAVANEQGQLGRARYTIDKVAEVELREGQQIVAEEFRPMSSTPHRRALDPEEIGEIALWRSGGPPSEPEVEDPEDQGDA